MLPKWIGTLAWLWLVIVGSLMFTPLGPFCIACGRALTQTDYVIGVGSIVLGLAGILTQIGGSAR